MKQLYNEGRVLGLSAYELYYRNAKYYDPDRAPASEKEWLSSTLAMGSSLLLKVGTTKDVTHGYTSYFIDLPENSRLTAANTIIASIFLGEAYVPEEDEHGWGWATKVTDYGKLIDNSDGPAYHYPSEDGTYVPFQAPGDLTDEAKDQIKEYAKIMDGIVLQPGTWAENENKPPHMDYTPDLSKVASIRFSFKDKITKPFYILLTGFTNKIVDAGESGFDSPVNSPSPADGDFLGPWQFPWAAKIIFTVSNAVLSYALDTDEKVEDLQALQLYNTPYLYMFKAKPGNHEPTPEDLEDVHDYILNQKIYGYMSDTFISRYCMSANDVVNNFGSDGAPWISHPFFFTMFDQVEKIGDSWKYGDKAINSPYKYFFMANGPEQASANQQYFLVPIDSRTNMIAVTLPSAKSNIVMRPATNEEDTIRYASFDMSDKLNYLGSWWNGTSFNPSDPNLANWGPYEDHPTQKAAIPDVTAYYQPYSVVPKPPVEYGYDYYAWLSNTPVYNTMIAEEYWNTTSGINEEKIHISYKGLSCMEFLRAAATKYLAYDIDSPDALQVDLGELTFRRFLIPVDSVNETIENGISDGSFVVPLEADVSISATIDAENFFAPADITITTLDTENPTDVTSQYRSTKHNIWCSVGNVNEHFTKSVSLIDQYGTPLSLQGSSSKQSVDEIVWVDLLDALNHNKSLDILGSDMKALKTALDSAEADKTYGFKKNADGTFELVEVGE